MRDAAAIVGVAQTPFSKHHADSELSLALRVIRAALDDAGLAAAGVDGLVKNAMEATEEHAVARALGVADLRFFGQIGYGGGATCGMVAHAAGAVAAGLANTVVCWRVRKRASGGRPWARVGNGTGGDAQFGAPYGLLRPADQVALLMRRHMVEYGSTSAQLGAIQLYDSFTPFVLFALEAYGFCPQGEGGRFAADGHLQWPAGSLPVNTHGGSLSEGYIQGMNHVIEAVRQVRGTANTQLPRVDNVLVTSSTSVPTSAIIVASDR